MRDIVVEKVFRQPVRSKGQDVSRETVVTGPPGAPSAASGTFHYTQSSPASVWSVQHNLNRKPDVTLFLDSDPDTPVWTDIEYPDDNNLVIILPDPATGQAYM